MIKAALSGSHGTGKSTLLEQLQASWPERGVRFLSEVPRDICTRVDDPTFLQRANSNVARQLLVVTSQIVTEAQASDCAVMMTDRSIADHWAYTVVLHPGFARTVEGQQYENAVRQWLGTYDMIFYLPIEFPMDADGVREDDERFRVRVDGELRGLYEKSGTITTRIAGPPEMRANRVRSEMDSLMGGSHVGYNA